MAGTIPFRRFGSIGGSTQSAPQPAADAATAAGLGALTSALHPPEDCPAAAGADQHLGPSDAAPWAEPTAEPRPETAGAPIPVGTDRLHNPC